MRLATWNVNGIRARLPRLLEWLANRAPDVLCLQEIKCTDEQFPREELAALGYGAAVHGEKGRNGVAILARQPLTDVFPGVPGSSDGARVVAASVAGWRVASVYVVNGVEVGHPRYADKLAWLEGLAAYVAGAFDLRASVALAGDWNVTFDDRDVHDPPAWHEQNLCSTPERQALARLMAPGLVDAFRTLHPEDGRFTWWDYRAGAFHKNLGLRIDHVLVSHPALARCTAVDIDRDARKGKTPSDHAPVIATFTD